MSTPENRLEIVRPDDFHVHFRDAAMLGAVVPETARHFSRAIVMPNLVPPVVTVAQALDYRERILGSCPTNADSGEAFDPLMTLYLTETTSVSEIERAATSDEIKAVKLYPAGATTNSASGVTDITRVMPLLEAMAKTGLTLCVHGEVTDAEIDIFDREAVFISRVLEPVCRELPELRVVMEHITTSHGVDFVRSGSSNIAATVTPHHLILNRNHLLAGGIRPHYYCLPIVKREEHRLALRQAVTSGDKSFFLGTDSAPHTTDTKEAACGCAGVFNATNTMACLAQVFEEEESLPQLEAFSSLNGADFYKLPNNQSKLTLQRQDTPVKFPETVSLPGDSGAAKEAQTVTVFDPGIDIFWSVVD